MELYDLPQGWVWTTVTEIFDIIGGGTPSTQKNSYWEGEIPWISSADIQGLKEVTPRRFITPEAIENSTTNLVPKDSVIVVTRVGLGKVAIAPFDLCFSQDSQALIPKIKGLFSEYILYYLSQAVQIFKYQNRGTTIAGVTKKQLADLPIPLPPLPEQERIVEAIESQLSRIEAGVASVRNAQRALRRYKASVLNAACTGQLLPQDPNDEPATLLLERILAERRERWESEQREKYTEKGKPLPKGWQDKYPAPAAPDTTDLPDLPEGWVWASVEQISFLDVGFAFKSNEFTDTGVRLLRGDNIEPGSLRWIDTKYWATDNIDLYKHLLLISREIVLAMDRPLISTGLKIARVHPSDLPCLLVQRMARFRLIQRSVEDYLYLSLQINSFINHLVSGQTGTQLPHISSRNINEYVFPLPPLAEQTRIVEEVERRLSVVAALEQTVTATLQRAARLRQSVLRKAFRGELVGQDQNDESAEALLARVREERAKQGASYKMRMV